MQGPRSDFKVQGLKPREARDNVPGEADLKMF